jgi:hypothetical protein
MVRGAKRLRVSEVGYLFFQKKQEYRNCQDEKSLSEIAEKSIFC